MAKQYVVMEGVVKSNRGQRFFTNFTPGIDQTRSITGEVWYKIIGYADSPEEALFIIGGEALAHSFYGF